MPILMGRIAAGQVFMGQLNFDPSQFSIVTSPSQLRRGASYSINVTQGGNNVANVTATLGGQPVTVTSANSSVIGITIPQGISLKHSNVGYPLVLSVAGIGSASTSNIPLLPPNGWDFVDLIDPVNSSTNIRAVDANGNPSAWVTGDQIVFQQFVSPGGLSGGNGAVTVYANAEFSVNTGEGVFSPQVFSCYGITAAGVVGAAANQTVTYNYDNEDIDITPNVFALQPAFNVALLDFAICETVVIVSGITAGIAIPVSVPQGGQYRISTNGGVSYGPWTSAIGTVELNHRVQVRLQVTDQYSTQSTMVLDINGVTAQFNATTIAAPSVNPALTISATQNSAQSLFTLVSVPQNYTPSTGITFEYRIGAGDWQHIGTDSVAPYSVDFNSAPVADGSVIQFRATNVFQGNLVVSGTVNATVHKRPAVTSFTGPNSVQGGQFYVFIAFSKAISGFSVTDFQLSAGSLSGLVPVVGGSNEYRVTVTPPENSSGNLQISLPENTVQDIASGLSLGNTPSQVLTIPYDTQGAVSQPQILSIGGDNVVTSGETVTIEVQNIDLTQINQCVLAGPAGEYVVPWNGTNLVTIPSIVPQGIYTLVLRRFLN